MFIHSVYFWLKPELTDADRAAFAEGLRALGAIETVRSVHIGTPVPSDRPVVDNSYTFGLVVDLGDQAGHDAYQTHPVHLEFLAQFKPFWTKIQVYDFV